VISPEAWHNSGYEEGGLPHSRLPIEESNWCRLRRGQAVIEFADLTPAPEEKFSLVLCETRQISKGLAG
jgi:hypothetical protein